MRLGVHALVGIGGWSPAEAWQAIASTAEAGYDLIEIPLLDPSSVDAADTRKVLDEHGIGAGCSLGLAPETNVSSEDPEAVAAGRALLADALRATVELGADYLGGVLYGVLGRHEAAVTERGYANAVEAMRELSDNAAREGVTIGLEVVNRYESNVLNTTEQGLKFLDDIGSPNATLHLDTYHMNIEESGMAEAIETVGERLGYFHVGESNRGPLGSGTVDFAATFAALDRIGYDGTITFESFSSAVVSPALTRALCIWRETWNDGMDLAVSARQFVERRLAAAATTA
jgi:D-psicose/D-tagatose/L-ribulose 3-epimerase